MNVRTNYLVVISTCFIIVFYGETSGFAQSWTDSDPQIKSIRVPVTMGKPVPVVTMQSPQAVPESTKPRVRSTGINPTQEGELPWMPRLLVRGAMPEDTSGKYISLYGPPPVPPPAPSANPFPPTGPSGPPGPPPPSVGAPISDSPVDQPLQNSWWDKTCGAVKGVCAPHSDCQTGWFQSDRAYDGMFASPITNPFLFEDPRSLTEVKPLYIYQSIPARNTTLGGGSADFFGLQGRLAINESWSVVINRLGWVSFDPTNRDTFSRSTGFGEFWLGPKWTFFRAPASGTAIAGGLTFQIPVGSSKVVQNTGTLGLAPYISIGQNINAGTWGSFNLINTTGIDFGVGNQRSDFFYNSFHLDYDVRNAHVFYPVLELNYFNYIGNGKARSLNFDGADMFNFGATNINGRGMLSLAPGMRYKFTEHFQIGTAIDFLLTSPRDTQDVRLVFDMIFRY